MFRLSASESWAPAEEHALVVAAHPLVKLVVGESELAVQRAVRRPVDRDGERSLRLLEREIGSHAWLLQQCLGGPARAEAAVVRHPRPQLGDFLIAAGGAFGYGGAADGTT